MIPSTAIKKLAETIYISKDFAQNSDLGRWALEVLTDERKEELRNTRFVDGRICEKTVDPEDYRIVEWKPVPEEVE